MKPVVPVGYRNVRPSPYVAGCWGIGTMDDEETLWFRSKAAALAFLIERSVVGRIVSNRIRAGLYRVCDKPDGHINRRTYYVGTAETLRQEGWEDAIDNSTYVGDRRMTRAVRRAGHRTEGGPRFDCEMCGHGVIVDEDGCCVQCGLDTTAGRPGGEQGEGGAEGTYGALPSEQGQGTEPKEER